MNRRVATKGSSLAEGTIESGEIATQAGKEHAGKEAGKGSASTSGSSGKGKPRKAAGKRGGQSQGDVGQMLRGAYRQTVDEAIPDDLMDLLNKLE